jgi:hypothetical protein
MLTEQLLAVLHEGVRALPQPLPAARPRILLGTVPGEPHALALLLAQALCAADGTHCIPLGPQTPLSNLVLAADAYRADIVLLGFSGCGTPNEVVDGLTELRGKLAPAVELWAGGAVPVLQRRRPEGVELLEGLDVLASRLHQWRSARNLV